jgi:hypothetical protein
MSKQCECGREIYHRAGSTIQPKKCPSCQLKAAQMKAKKSGGKSAAMKTADMWHSRYVRMKYSFPDISGKELLCKCYTCGNIKPIKTAENGHYHGRGIKATRYDENNSRPQCTRCNKFLSGCHTAFEANLIKEVGVEVVEELKSLTVAYFKADEAFFRETANKYRKLFYEQVNIKGINPWESKPKTK